MKRTTESGTVVKFCLRIELSISASTFGRLWPQPVQYFARLTYPSASKSTAFAKQFSRSN